MGVDRVSARKRPARLGVMAPQAGEHINPEVTPKVSISSTGLPPESIQAGSTSRRRTAQSGSTVVRWQVARGGPGTWRFQSQPTDARCAEVVGPVGALEHGTQ